jgi:fucose 4-O-acetylase-like acetyltransferase
MKEVKKRILWVDIAKALTILSVPISHTLPLDWTIRSMIFSFHMPLFFILSGFTTKLATDWKTLWKRLKKNFLYLIVPTFLVLIIFTIFDTLGKTNIAGFFPNFAYWLNEFFINKYPEGFYTASAVWFLVALFWAKLIMDLVNVIFKTEKNGVVFILLGMLGITMGVFGFRPPLFLDLGFMAILFMEIGLLWRKYEEKINKYNLLITAVAAIYWFSRTMRGDYLEMWTRFYAGFEVSILVAVAGTWLVCEFSKMIEESAKGIKGFSKKAFDSLITLGKNTMLLYLVHSLDYVLFGDLWEFRDGRDCMVWFSIVIRLALNLAVYVIVKNVICLVKIYKSERTLSSLKK